MHSCAISKHNQPVCKRIPCLEHLPLHLMLVTQKQKRLFRLSAGAVVFRLSTVSLQNRTAHGWLCMIMRRQYGRSATYRRSTVRLRTAVMIGCARLRLRAVRFKKRIWDFIFCKEYRCCQEIGRWQFPAGFSCVFQSLRYTEIRLI